MKKIILILLIPILSFSQIKVKDLPSITYGRPSWCLLIDTLATGGTRKITVSNFISTYSLSAQTLSISTNTLSISGGNSVVVPSSSLTAGSGVSLTGSLGTYTITNTGYLNGGNSFGGNATIGLNDNYGLIFKTNNTNRGAIMSNGNWIIGGTSGHGTKLFVNSTSNAASSYNIKSIDSLGRPLFYSKNSGYYSFNDSVAMGSEYGRFMLKDNNGTGTAASIAVQRNYSSSDYSSYPSFLAYNPDMNSVGEYTRVLSFSDQTGYDLGALFGQNVGGGEGSWEILTRKSSVFSLGLKVTGTTLYAPGSLGIGVSSPTAELHVNGNFRLVDGTESNGYVLTSDANGNASWAASSGGGGGGAVDTIKAGTGISIANSAGSYTVTNTGVLSTTGTTNQITVTGTTTPTLSISTGYVGQSSITTVGTVTSGVWNSTITPPGLYTNAVASNTITLNGHNTYQEIDSTSSSVTTLTVSYSNIPVGATVIWNYMKTTASNCVITWPTGTLLSSSCVSAISGQNMTLVSGTSGDFLFWITRMNGGRYIVTEAQNSP